jgi:pyridoxine 4-dehydrogenase
MTDQDARPNAAAAGTFALGEDLLVNRLGFGAMRLTGRGILGEPEDPEEARRVLRRALELGVNLIDTADSYGPEVSERLIAEALHPYPDDLVIATKGGFTRPGGRWVPNGRPEHLREACESSLKRLKVERIDLYQLHRPDTRIAFEDSVWALALLREEGKIRHVGLSNVGVRELEIALDIVPVASVQNRYNLSDRSSEAVLQACEREEVGFIPWYPLATGRLARRVDPSTRSPSATTPPQHRWRSPGSLGTRPRCCPSQVPRRSRTWRRTWRQRRWSSRTRRWRCWREADRRRTIDAGVVGPGIIGAKATPCLEFSAYLSRIVRADERSWRQGIALTHCDYQRLPV